MSLMSPPTKFLVSKRSTCCSKLVAVILLLNKIMPSCSRRAEKGLIYIAIAVSFS